MSRSKKPKADAGDERGAAPERAWSGRRMALHLTAAAILTAGCIVAFTYMREYVVTEVTAADAPPKVVFKNRPVWMTDLVAEKLTASFRPSAAESVFRRDTLVQINRRLKANPWISTVREVRRLYGRGPGDTIEVDCDFRAPIALVRDGSDWWFVDAAGVKLPEKFPDAQVRQIGRIVYGADGRPNVRMIDGVAFPPPRDAGKQWAGDDLAAALDLVRRLYGQAFADDIIKVNVSNYGGRVDAREAQIVLETKYGTEVRWGRPWQATDGFIEVRPERKMASLRRIVEEFGRVDARHPWIDIRFDRITYPTPGAAADPSAAQTAAAQDAGR